MSRKSTAVIIPCYNLGETVTDALNSVHHQTIRPAEIVIIDDGSDDIYTRQVLSRLQNHGTCVLRTQNRGVAAARNLGIRLTSSPYIVLLDADDRIEPTYLERASRILDEKPGLDFVTCSVQAFEGASYTWTPPLTLMDTIARGGPHISTMFRRRVWESVGGFDESLSGYEDMDFWISALENGSHGELIEEPLLHYRIRSRSRYHTVILPFNYNPVMETIYQKHRVSILNNGKTLLQIKDQFIQDQKQYKRHLEDKRSRLESELSVLEDQIKSLTHPAKDRKGKPLDLDDLRQLASEKPPIDPFHERSVLSHYVQNFLLTHQKDIKGNVLEVTAETLYHHRLGTCGMMEGKSANAHKMDAYALSGTEFIESDQLPSDCFDCVVMINTIQFIYDCHAALEQAKRVLKPNGVLLCTLPGIYPVIQSGAENDWWRFTPAAVYKIFSDRFGHAFFEVKSYGNVMAGTALINGMSAEHLNAVDLEKSDPLLPILIGVRAVKYDETNKGGNGRKNCPIRVSQDICNSGAIIFYHRVAELKPDMHHLCVSPGDFRQHMRALKETFCPMSLDDMVQAAERGKLPAGAVAVTFDDGYIDNLKTVSPILLEYGIPATFFISAQHNDKLYEYWWDIIERIFFLEQDIPKTLDLHEDGRQVFPTGTVQERRETHNALIESVYAMSYDDRNRLVQRLTEWSGKNLEPRETHRPMIAPEIRELAARPGHAIGCHTLHHLTLTLQPLDARIHEIGEDKRCMEQILGRCVSSFSYPYGDYDQETVKIVQCAGFTQAVTVEGRTMGFGADRYLLPRFEIRQCSAKRFTPFLTKHLKNL